MGPHSAATWRVSIGCATLWLILAVASTLEVYDDVPPVDSDLDSVYQDDNHLDTGPDLENQNIQSKTPPEDQLLYEILKALHQEMDYRHSWSSLRLRPKLVKENYRSYGLENFGMVKRLVDAFGGSRMQYRPSQSSLRLQQKWKIKKGKVGSQMVCYFKLCAFRPPA